MRQSHANWDSMVYPNWCNRIWCIHECHGRAAMSQMATVCNDWCEHLIYQYFSIAMAIWMCPMWLAFRMLELKRFHWLAIHPNHRWALLWFFSPSSSFPCELLCVWKRNEKWKWFHYFFVGRKHRLKLCVFIAVNDKVLRLGFEKKSQKIQKNRKKYAILNQKMMKII